MVAQEVKDEKSGGEEEGGKEKAPPGGLDGVEEGGPIGQEGSPAGERGLHTEAEEAEEGFLENDGGEGESEVGQNGGEDLRKDLAKKDGGSGLADQAGG